ncbi:3,4-dihydroxy-2-butanone-4-phosphate synthase [Solemya velum gill symbiont]|uniref:3,4-dihydroxy-2-butanone-4-phosphate synthase n=1 Tax=Solemya velum gill symbiont TaxID=2340 RepID=UPI0009977645|nr:3,4-dihydroxy-2-butanone-4-phosphate synthase [Solemya velum gill symbiont]OOY43185.1 3,4-dihydroxy-2-butanone-4-phosphate synthase [Solemya velum gill symbiont]
MALNSIDEIIEDIRQGKMVIIMDDEDRENEGDLLMAAEAVTPDAINFMATHGRGLICLTLTDKRCKQLRLPLMVSGEDLLQSTNFTVSIEAAEGVTTGISAGDRATTVLAAVAEDATPQDLVQPGHIFPLMAQPGGTLVRAGHTEAGCDLARLAGYNPAGVIVEIEDLIQYRIRNEKTVERINSCDLPTDHGDFKLYAYEDTVDRDVHMALVMGEPSPDKPVLVRVHVQNSIHDLFDANISGSGWPLRSAMEQIAREGEGVIVVLRNHDSPKELVQRIEVAAGRASAPAKASGDADSRKELRTLGAGAQILADLGVGKMRVMSAPINLHGLHGFNLEVVEFVESE